ncbi:methionine ABC transporter ATP-binding protein [Rappaport israeli]|uniref:methionine ABC transporter ATP-binding protein n=1 Tax=Rappaport israeli TaxID=1839807 RepID=UPI000931FB7C|nr:methionine ABC transporter ATP-binding protein [Rappaport israeli]
MIRLNHLNKIYTHRGKTIPALEDVSLHVPKGQIYGVVGQSGAGKSTLIRCVNLLERPTSGQVIVDNQDLTKLSANQLNKARHNIGMIFQHFNLLSSRNVFDNIALPLELIGLSRKKIEEKVLPLLELTGLSDKRHHYPSQLSGGQKQRVAIARALASEPKVLLSDEATSALDPHTTDAILELLNDINQKLGLTILMITHEMEVVKKICHSVALIEGGKLVEHNQIENFFSNPQSPLGKRFIAQIHKFDLPAHIQQQLSAQGNHPVIKLTFDGEHVGLPILSSLTEKFGIHINIMQAKIEHIRTINMGLLIAELIGSPNQTQQALAHLQALPITTEILGYVQSNH